MNPKSYESHGAGDPTAVPAALGLGLLAVGGWLLTTARPWHKPGHPLTLGLGWTASGVLLLCGLVLLARCVRTVHGSPEAPAPSGPEAGAGAPADTGTDG
ncbi:hypothetical protein [Streptomyces avidinii]|uniref:MYXO-CTERM domain-containing protein n=1 Tax=Streptomyces avidinii TaxID=1895 RepID=A0ABS4L9G0_STRAV|nr:hypothetical protein [Streptomyces avidinii]MBP2038737.1 hypothetical protein [Streptomyces avidinii]GGZ11952.1 hypothetical protein GCM10010343_43540 [Streptomyces avidinii]